MAATRNKAPRKSAGIEHVKVSSSTAKKRAVAPKKDGVGAKSTSAAKTASGKARAKITPVAVKASPSKASTPARTPAAKKPLSETATRAVAKTAKTVARAVNAVEKAVSGVKKTVGAVKTGVSKKAAVAAAAPKATAKRAAKSVQAAATTARGAAQSAGAKAGKTAKAVTSAAKAAGKAAAKTAGKAAAKGSKAAGREPEVKAAPKVGSRAPDFELSADDGSKVSLASLRGKNVVLYFYPRDMTPGCTVEACGFRDHYDEIEEKNAVVLGVSRDSIASHVKFKEKENLPFPLLSDPDAEVISSYGSWGEKTFMGKKSMGILRTTVLIDGDGKVRKVYPKVSTQDHATEVLRDLAALEA